MLAAAYGWAPSVLRELTDAEATYYLSHMREVHLRGAFPLAQFEATVLNLMGGKRPPDQESSTPPLADHERFTAFERLPWFARPEWVEETGAGVISQEAAKDFLANLDAVPAWALESAPLHAIKNAAMG